MKRKLLLFALIISALCVPKMYAQDCVAETITKQYHFTENFDSAGIATWEKSYVDSLPCWSKYNDANPGGAYNVDLLKAYPFVCNNGARSGSQCVDFAMDADANYASNEVLILPQVTNDVSTLRLNFWAKTTTFEYTIMCVGVMSDPADLSTFVSVDSITFAKAFAYEQKEVDFASYTGTGKYIAIRVMRPANGSYSLYLDDVELSPAPTCIAPTGVVASDVTSSQATLSWTAGKNETAWNLRYVEAGTTDTTTVAVSTNPYVLKELKSNTTYQFIVQSDCSDEQSGWTESVSFKTLCNPTDPATLGTVSFEASEGYESESGLAENCWTVGGLQAPNYKPYIYSNGCAHTGSNCMLIGAYYESSDQADSTYAIMPSMTFAQDIANYQVKFWMRKRYTGDDYYHENDTLYIGIVSDPSDMSTLQIVGSAINTTASYKKYRVKLTNYTGGTTGYIVFLSVVDQNATQSVKEGAFFVDDITVEQQLPCEELETLSITDVTRIGLTANWAFTDAVPANCTGYEVKVTTTNDPEATAVASATIGDPDTTTYTFTGLDRETMYYIHVRSNCGATGYSNWLTASAMTEGLIGCYDITVADGTEQNDYVPVFGYYADAQQKTQSIYPASMLEDLVGKSISTLKYYVSSGSSAGWPSAVFNIRMMETDATTLSDIVSTTDATLVYNGTLSASVESGMEIYLTTPFTYNGGNLLIAFELQNTSGYSECQFYGISATSASILTFYYSYYDRWEVVTNNFLPKVDFGYCGQLEACPAVTATIDSITDNSAVVSWTASEADYFGSYDVLVSDSAATDLASKTPQYTGITATSLSLTDLDEYADYYVYIRVNCNGYGKDDGAAWSEGVYFQTLSPCNVPTNLSVDLMDKTTAVCYWTSTAQPDNYRYILSDTIIADFEAVTPTAKGIYADSALLTGLTLGTTYYFYLSNLCGKTLGHSPWVSTSFTTPDACISPDTAYIEDIQQYQVTLVWELNQFADTNATYDIVYDTVQITDFTSVSPKYTGVTGTSQVIDTLLRNTTYYIYLRSNCGDSTTNWMETSATTADIGPDCKDIVIADGEDDNMFLPFLGNFMDESGLRSQCLYRASLLAAQKLNGATISSMSFYTWSLGDFTYTANTQVSIGITSRTDLSSGFDNTPLTKVFEGNLAVIDQVLTIQFSEPFIYPEEGGNLLIEFKNTTGGNSSPKFFIGASQSYLSGRCSQANFTASFLPMVAFNTCFPAYLCPSVEAIVIPEGTRSNDHALISWNRGKGDFTSSYDVLVSDSIITDFTDVTPTATAVTDTFYNATSLTANTTYYVYVRATCKQGIYDDGCSEWSNGVSFTTEDECVKPYDFQVTGVTYNTVSFQWINRNNNQNWMLVRSNGSTSVNDTLNIEATGDTCRYTLNSGFVPATVYYFGLSALCTDTSEMVYTPAAVRTYNNETNIRIDAFTSLEVVDEITSDTTAHAITATVRKGSDMKDAYFNYTTSDGVSYVIVGNDTLMGNNGHLDFTNPVTLTVVAEDTTFRQNWMVTLTEEPCATVYNLAAANVSRLTADLTWNVGDNSTSFDFVFSTTELTDPSTGTVQNITVTNVDGVCTYALANLERETTYFAYIRTNCGATQGQWRGTSFTTNGLSGCLNTIVNEGTATSSCIPYYGWGYEGSFYKTQFIYPSEMLTELRGKTLSKMTFFTQTENMVYDGAIAIRIGITNANNVNTAYEPSPETVVYTGVITVSNYQWVLDFGSTTFDYPAEGGNLLFEFTKTADGSAYSYDWYYGTDGHVAGISRYSDGGGEYTRDFLPKVQIDYCFVVDPCPEIADLIATNIQATSATISWTATGDYLGTADIYVSTAQVLDTTGLVPTYAGIDTTSYNLTNLSAYTDYYVYVRTHCNASGHDDGVSDWVEVTFKTESECEYPRNVMVALTSKNSAHLTWTDAQGLTPTTAYEYAYSTTDAEPASGTTSSTGSADILGLTANTAYYFYVRKVCDVSTHSPWVKVTLNTPAELPAVLNVTASNISFNAFTATWTRDYSQFANETEWQYAIVKADSALSESDWKAATDTMQIVCGLTESTTYDFYVRATDGQGHYSQNAMIPVTTTARPSDCNTVAEVGVAVTSSMPLVSNWGSEYSISIYTADELTARGFTAGTIETIGYYQVSCGNTTTVNKYQKATTVWMGNVTKSSFSGPMDWISTNDLTLVKNAGTVDFNKVNDWVTITLDNAFVWDGTSNIAVAMLANTTGSYTTSSFSRATASDTRAIYYKTDDPITLTSGGVSPGTGDYTSYRPNIQFCFEPASCPQPTHLVVDNITATEARASWYPGNTETEWSYIVSTEKLADDVLNTMVATNTTTAVSVLAGLTKDTEYHFYVQSKCSEADSSKWAHITFSTLPTCDAPINAVAVSAAHNQITFDAAAGSIGTVGTYDFRYWKDGSTDTVTIAGQTATYVASDLAIGLYHWQVRANCTGSEEGASRWTVGNDVQVCGTFSLPYTQSFEDIPTTYSGPGMIESICWNDLNVSTNPEYLPQYYGYTESATEGDRSLCMEQYEADAIYLIMPEFDNEENFRVKFDAATSHTDFPNKLQLGYLTDITDTTTFVTVYTVPKYTYWQEYTAYFYNVPAGARMAFKYDSYEYISYAFIDNLRVDTIPTWSLASSVAPDANFGSVEMTCQASDTTADGLFNDGATPVLQAIATPGYYFTNWTSANTGDTVSYDDELLVEMTQDTALVANFAPLSFRVNVVVSSEDGQEELGDVSGSGIYEFGNYLTIEATNISAYYHVVWPDGNTDNPRHIAVPAKDTTIVATFTDNLITSITTEPYKGIYDAQAHSVSVNGTVAGDSVTYSTDSVNWVASFDRIDVSATKVFVKVTRSNYYDYVTADSVVITKRQLTITGTTIADTKEWDGTTVADVTEVGTLSGVLNGDDVIVSATAAYDDPEVGTNKPVQVEYTLSGDKADNYIAPASITLYADITSQATGMDKVNSNARIYVIGYELYVEGLTGDYTIYSTTGQLIYTGDAAQYTLPQTGNYLVRYQGGAVKVQAKH